MLPAPRFRGWLRPGGRFARFAVPAALALAVASGLPHAQTPPKSGSTATDPLPGGSPHSKLNRQLDIFARVLDDLLIDSEHALVSHGRNASGAYLPGYGAVFTLEFSLVGPFGVGGTLAVGDGHYRFHRWDKDEVGVFFYDDDDEDEDDDNDKDKNKNDDENKDRKRRRHRGRIDLPGIDDDLVAELDADDLRAHRTRQYGKVKLELIDTLGEYGDMIDGVPADEWVTVVARPTDLPWGERKIKRLVLRARMRDVLDRAENRIGGEAFRERAVVEEYK